MANLPDLESLAEQLEQQRDELKLRVHLAGLEVRDEWDKAEQHWAGFQARLKQAKEIGAESSGDIGAAVALLGEELRDTYQRIRKLF